jgi:hypothetical protein
MRESSFAPGNADPQIRQNQDCQSAFGSLQVPMCSVPRIHRKASLSTITTAIPLLPVNRRQIEQWHTNTSESSALSSNATAPQLHSPFGIGLKSDSGRGALRTIIARSRTERPQSTPLSPVNAASFGRRSSATTGRSEKCLPQRSRPRIRRAAVEPSPRRAYCRAARLRRNCHRTVPLVTRAKALAIVWP